ncbi:hypothetical protein ILP92_13680 [Maribius pontilimi]|uniref:Four-carbon acid sugar kinase family protein n=1 Tax=Palleronia pontilimi TaxID=1964209 RepID=A0A934MDD8_9RHOB|nr:four-carbon acid sugar kinase family protein [Palleronia pontilimi]MBJ3763803.1 hypothetical protein [Palleronia pontilimi]
MLQVLIIADDLTGALDSAVAFAGGGRRVLVARGVSFLAEALERAPEVLSVNLASREGDAATARTRMDACLGQIDVDKVPVVMKKVDSRLKGHVGVECAALADAMAPERIVVLPAVPQMGRVQVDGAVSGDGIDAPIALAPLFDRPVTIPDATTDAHLDDAVRVEGRVLWVGARGLGFALARRLYGRVTAGGGGLSRPLVIAVGSRDPITLRQVDVLHDLAPVTALPDGRVAGIIEREPVGILQMTDSGAGRAPADAARDFAEAVVSHLRAARPAALLATGGETAQAILDRLDIGVLDVVAELAPGLPISTVRVPWGMLQIATKSGGFGGPLLMEQIVRGR